MIQLLAFVQRATGRAQGLQVQVLVNHFIIPGCSKSVSVIGIYRYIVTRFNCSILMTMPGRPPNPPN